MTNAPFDLKARAHQAMIEAGFHPDFPAEVIQEVHSLKQATPGNAGPAIRDLRALLWSSIEYIVEPPGTEHEGHFGLAVHDYTHSTAPNRRYADLVTQRLLKATLAAMAAPYSVEGLGEIAAHCTEREDAARKVERLMRKVVAASLLGRRIGETFEGIVTGASPKGTYVRLLKFPAEGQVVRGQRGIDVGDRVQVRLASVDAVRGFIDFERN